ncbi:hypothetical protein SEPL_048 [Salmonella phage SE_PL]|uniref:hypothetical protein n=1 Tax=Salmonella enterica TaxID=28901 RepID=UPI001163A95F|nr:hypothetical protein 7t3_0560 [Salmonella phage 7t3]QIG62661.1 hypothetical protein SEPL_048 [Salmonella phage SE_PL]WNV47486.1 hypothetical protein [Klebsiella phage fENko-Kae01]
MTNSEKLNKMLYTFFLADDGIYNEERIFSYMSCNATRSKESFDTFYYMDARCSLNFDCIEGVFNKLILYPDSYNSDVPFLSIDRDGMIIGGCAGNDKDLFFYKDCIPTSTELKKIGMNCETLDLLNFILIKFKPIMDRIQKKFK